METACRELPKIAACMCTIAVKIYLSFTLNLASPFVSCATLKFQTRLANDDIAERHVDMLYPDFIPCWIAPESAIINLQIVNCVNIPVFKDRTHPTKPSSEIYTRTRCICSIRGSGLPMAASASSANRRRYVLECSATAGTICHEHS